MNKQQNKRQALLVVGAHRSGTSALTRVINLHGATLGTKLPEPAFDNESGFWENQAFVDLHERLLAHIGSSWDDPRQLSAGWLERVSDAGYLDELCRCIENEFGDALFWAVKDPRICRLLPLWLQALARLEIEPRIIFMVRDPAEVVSSLARRNALGSASAALLWLRHVAESVRVTNESIRCMTTYESLLQNWRQCMQGVADELGLAWPRSSSDYAPEVDAYLRPELRHEKSLQSRHLLPEPWREDFQTLYAACRAREAGKITWNTMQNRLETTLHALGTCEPLVADMQPKSMRDQLQARITELGEARGAYKAEAARLLSECETRIEELFDARRITAHAQQISTRAQEAASGAEQRREVAEQGREVAEQGRKEAVQGREVAEQGREVAEQGREEAEKRREVAVQGREVAEQGREVAEQRREVAEQGREVAEQGREEAEQTATGLRAELLEMRGELAKSGARVRALKHVQDDLELIKSSRSWRWTRGMRFMLRTMRQRGLTDADRERILRWRQRLGGDERGSSEVVVSMAPPSAAGGEITKSELGESVVQTDISPVSQCTGDRDYFVFSVIDWHFRTQRPQHLARELAADGHRVFYLSNVFVDSEKPGFQVEKLDDEGRLFQIQLNLRGSPAIYHAPPTHDAQEMLRASMAELLKWSRTRGCVSMVQHPYWLETARMLPDHRLLYDCMDHHGGFADNTPEVLARERELMKASDLLIVTSDWLNEEVGKYNPHRIMIRNACQYEHFADFDGEPFKDAQGRRVIGYYGAIAEWFDLELIEKVAHRFSQCLVLLIGADTTGAAKHLAHLSNVQFTGEVKYDQLPAYLAGFDVCMLPFRIIPLTLATNPVKIYEYLSAGKEVVSIKLPEIVQFGDLVRLGSDHAEFLDVLGEALDAEPDLSVIEARKTFAAEQTWAHRGRDLINGVRAIEDPKVSVIVVTYNNLALTKTCLRSLDQYTDYPNLELIVVDNASTDGSPDYLREWASGGPERHVILNDDNRGFAAANNQGLAMASGEYLVMLNNDTHVTPGWVSTLIAHLRRHDLLGMVGPVTNNIGNEARIEIAYTDMEEMLEKAADYTRRHAGISTPIRTAAFFCVMMPREVYEKAGFLDEDFGIGFFEDDDYCRRVEQAGWSVACADDVFIHHHLSASFDKLKQDKRQELFEKNKVLYERKWGEWIPHSYRNASSC